MASSVLPTGRSRSAVLGTRIGAGTGLSLFLHGAVFAVFIFMLLRGMIREDVDTTPQVSVVDFEVPPDPPPRPHVTPPPPRPPPEPALEPHPAPAAIPHPAARAAPAVMAGAGHGGAGDGDGMAAGTATDWHGDAPAPEPPHDIPPVPEVHRPPPPPPPPPAPHEVADDELSVHPNIRCSSARIAALYPQSAIDNDAEADVAVEVLVDATGHVTRATARSDPGFGLAAASEQALLTACRPTAIPLDRDGNPAMTRVIHTMHWQLE